MQTQQFNLIKKHDVCGEPLPDMKRRLMNKIKREGREYLWFSWRAVLIRSLLETELSNN